MHFYDGNPANEANLLGILHNSSPGGYTCTFCTFTCIRLCMLTGCDGGSRDGKLAQLAELTGEKLRVDQAGGEMVPPPSE